MGNILEGFGIEPEVWKRYNEATVSDAEVIDLLASELLQGGFHAGANNHSVEGVTKWAHETIRMEKATRED